MTSVGAVSARYRHPVKSMLGEELGSAGIGPRGFAGDRVDALVDAGPAGAPMGAWACADVTAAGTVRRRARAHTSGP